MKRLRALSILLTGAAVLSLSSPAMAKQDVRSGRVFAVLAFTQVGAQPVTIEPRCPRKTQAIGGGFQGGVNALGELNPPRNGVAQITYVYESRRASRRAWRTSAITLTNPAGPPISGPGTYPAVAWSYCRAMAGKVIEVARSGPVVSSSGETSKARATCPRGTVAISGGFGVAPLPGPGFTYPSLFESFKSGRRSWTVSANPWTQATVSARSYVECARRGRPPVTRAAARQVRYPQEAVSAKCPRGKQAGSGGFRLSPNSGAVVLFSDAGPAKEARKRQEVGVPYPIGLDWAVAGGDPSAMIASTTAAFAYCS